MMDRVQAIPLSFGNASTSAVVYVSAPADGKLVSMQLVDAIGRITSYNVCYTKLLRAIRNQQY